MVIRTPKTRVITPKIMTKDRQKPATKSETFIFLFSTPGLGREGQGLSKGEKNGYTLV
jgi:hypothetical protein